MKKLLSILALMGALTVSSAEWELACTEDQVNNMGLEKFTIGTPSVMNGTAFLDKKPLAVDRKNKTATMWIAYVATKDGQKDFYDNVGEPSYGLNKAVKQIDYKNNKIRTLGFTMYRCDGSAIYSNDKPGTWDYIRPGSIDADTVDQTRYLVK